MPKTKRGIYHNLNESKYCISNGEIIFYFSSQLYKQKFLDGYTENRKTFLERLYRLPLEGPLNMMVLADIVFYQTIEKRGFRAQLKGVNMTWEEIHRYALRKMTEQNTPDWCEIQKPRLGEHLKIMESI